MKIFAIVVTYNRLNLLKVGLEALKRQTAKIDKIIVVNNGSTDSTSEWLKNQHDLFVINQENVGGAGGFQTGIKYAHETGADWIWMMDDDVKPEPDCLLELLKHSDISKCLHPKRICNDGKEYYWGNHFDIVRNRIIPFNVFEFNKKAFYFVSTGCFEGMLIHSEIVDEIGYPDSRFFIYGDDSVYGYLANHYTNVCCVNSAKMVRAVNSNDDQNRPMYLYYKFRNIHLMEEYSEKLTNTKFNIHVKSEYYRNALKEIVKIILRNYKAIYKIKLINAIIRGVIDANRKKINRSF